MKEDGWDGYEPDQNKTQWSFTGSLFYSIIVITTIGELFNTENYFYYFFRLLSMFTSLEVKNDDGLGIGQ